MTWQLDESSGGARRADALVAAPTGRRVLASVVEGVVLAALWSPALAFGLPAVLSGDLDGIGSAALWYGISLVLVTAFVLAQLLMHGRRGVTLGKLLFGLRSVNVVTHGVPGFWRGAVVRALVLAASCVVPVIGTAVVLASPLFDPERRGRGWHDKAAGTWIVDGRVAAHGPEPRTTPAAAPVDEHPTGAPAMPSWRAQPSAPAATGYRPGQLSGAAPTWSPPPSSQAPMPQAPMQQQPQHAPVQQPPMQQPPRQAPAQQWAPPQPQQRSQPNPPPPVDDAVEGATLSEVTAAPPASPVDRSGLDDDLERTRISARRQVLAVLAFDSGERMDLLGDALVGRNPTSEAGETHTHLVPLADDTRSVSKTHFALLVGADGMTLVDRSSTNGTVLVHDGIETQAMPGVPMRVVHGDTVLFGDRSVVVMPRG